MGNFYTNVVLPSADADRVVAALHSRGRTAYVASVAAHTFVYDEECEKQDLDELQGLAKLLSTELGTPALAAINHDDDVLWLALADGDRVTNVYNSNPAFFGEGSDRPVIRDVPRLCAVFGVPHRVPEVEALLAAPHERFIIEVRRHAELLEYLGVSSIGLVGFNYLYEDGIQEAGVTVRMTGGAPAPAEDVAAPMKGASGSAPPRPHVHDDKSALMTALMLGEARIPAGVEDILDEGRINGLIAFFEVQNYVVANGLVAMKAPDFLVRADAVVTRLFGLDEFSVNDLMQLVVERLDVWSSFTEQEIEAIKTGSRELEKRRSEAILRLQQYIASKFRP